MLYLQYTISVYLTCLILKNEKIIHLVFPFSGRVALGSYCLWLLGGNAMNHRVVRAQVGKRRFVSRALRVRANLELP